MDLFRMAAELASQLTPSQKKEMLKLYREQKARDSSLDESVEDLTQEIKDGFEHIELPDK